MIGSEKLCSNYLVLVIDFYMKYMRVFTFP